MSRPHLLLMNRRRPAAAADPDHRTDRRNIVGSTIDCTHPGSIVAVVADHFVHLSLFLNPWYHLFRPQHPFLHFLLLLLLLLLKRDTDHNLHSLHTDTGIHLIATSVSTWKIISLDLLWLPSSAPADVAYWL